MAEPRPLYNLMRIQVPSDFAVVVEGEKSANVLADALWPVVTWSGGSSAWKKTDFSPLFGKKIILWPDNDEPGFKCMAEIAAHLRRNGCQVFTLNVSSLGPAEDCADISNPLKFLIDNVPAEWSLMIADDLVTHEAARSI